MPSRGWFLGTRQLVAAFLGGLVVFLFAGFLVGRGVPVLPELSALLGLFGLLWGFGGATVRGASWLMENSDKAKRAGVIAGSGILFGTLVVIGLVLTFVGAALTLTIIGAPVGILLMIAGIGLLSMVYGAGEAVHEFETETFDEIISDE